MLTATSDVIAFFWGGRLTAIMISVRRKVCEIEALTIYARFGN